MVLDYSTRIFFDIISFAILIETRSCVNSCDIIPNMGLVCTSQTDAASAVRKSLRNAGQYCNSSVMLVRCSFETSSFFDRSDAKAAKRFWEEVKQIRSAGESPKINARGSAVAAASLQVGLCKVKASY
jgi:hypothetical protein